MIGTPRFDYAEISSTNDVARAAVADGISAGALFVAQHQSAGRGRRGTTWASQPGDSVLMSVVLYPTGPLETAWRAGWAACLAVIDMLRIYGIKAGAKWPNDIVVEHKKISGILVEIVTQPSGGYAAIVGIGINVKQADFDTGLAYRVPPTSMSKATNGQPPSIDEVIEAVCRTLEHYYFESSGNWDAVEAAYRKNLVLGQVQNGIDVLNGHSLTGVLIDVRGSDGAGRLLVDGSELRWAYPEIA